MNRRDFITGITTGSALALTGCLDDEGDPSDSVFEDRPTEEEESLPETLAPGVTENGLTDRTEFIDHVMAALEDQRYISTRIHYQFEPYDTVRSTLNVWTDIQERVYYAESERDTPFKYYGDDNGHYVHNHESGQTTTSEPQPLGLSAYHPIYPNSLLAPDYNEAILDPGDNVVLTAETIGENSITARKDQDNPFAESRDVFAQIGVSEIGYLQNFRVRGEYQHHEDDHWYEFSTKSSLESVGDESISNFIPDEPPEWAN